MAAVNVIKPAVSEFGTVPGVQVEIPRVNPEYCIISTNTLNLSNPEDIVVSWLRLVTTLNAWLSGSAITVTPTKLLLTARLMLRQVEEIRA